MSNESTLTVRQVAERYGVNVSKVLAWIAAGTLLAVNIAQRSGGRPRWRITTEAVEQFELARSSAPQPRAVRRRKVQAQAVTNYF